MRIIVFWGRNWGPHFWKLPLRAPRKPIPEPTETSNSAWGSDWFRILDLGFRVLGFRVSVGF